MSRVNAEEIVAYSYAERRYGTTKLDAYRALDALRVAAGGVDHVVLCFEGGEVTLKTLRSDGTEFDDLEDSPTFDQWITLYRLVVPAGELPLGGER